MSEIETICPACLWRRDNAGHDGRANMLTSEYHPECARCGFSSSPQIWNHFAKKRQELDELKAELDKYVGLKNCAKCMHRSGGYCDTRGFNDDELDEHDSYFGCPEFCSMESEIKKE